MIIDSDYQTLTIIDKGGIKIRNLNDYNILKYQEFDGNRIIIKLSDNCEIVETYNEGIFNVNVGSISMQITDYIELAKRIKFCMETKTDQPIKDLLLEHKKEELNREFLTKALSHYGNRIKFSDKIIIDDIFAIDENGQAYFLIKEKLTRLCIVAINHEVLKMNIDHALGNIKIDFRTKEIFCKALFLLFPDKTDMIFFNQLPEEIKSKI